MEKSTIPDSILHNSGKIPKLFEIDAVRFPINDFEPYLLCEAAEIIRRQEIFSDILTTPKLAEIYGGIYESIENLSTFFQKYGRADTNEEVFYSLIETHTFTNVIDMITSEVLPLVKDGTVRARDITEFVNACAEFSDSTLYNNIKNWLNNLNESMKNIKSVTLGANLDPQFCIREIGIVSVNPTPYVSGKWLDALMRDEDSPAEFKCVTSLGVHETKKLLGKSSVSINREMFTGFNNILKGTLRKIQRDIFEAFRKEAASLMSIGNDLKFITAAAKYILGLADIGGRLTFPRTSERTRIQGLYNPMILEKCGKANIVSNDLFMDSDRRSFILTGPNSGGKSVYLNSVGIAQLLFQLGLPIPASDAEMCVFDSIASIYVQDTVKTNDGRLASEVNRLKNCLTNLQGNALILLDETFSSTSAFDGVFLAESLIKYLSNNGCYLLYVTHLHELANRVIELNGEGYNIQMLTAQNIDGVRTFKIEPYDGIMSEKSLAKDIVVEHGLGFLFDGEK